MVARVGGGRGQEGELSYFAHPRISSMEWGGKSQERDHPGGEG